MKKYLTILTLLLSINAKATNHYFANTGSDASGNGSISQPYATIAKLNSIFSTFAAGDSVLFNRGDVFFGVILPNKSGTSGNPIYIGGYGHGANPIITGFVNVTGFTNIGGNIWESGAIAGGLNTCNILAINGVNTTMGRYPNTEYLTYQSHTTTSLTSNQINSAVTNWTGADVVFKPNHFALVRTVIKSHSGSTINFDTVKTFNDGSGLFIENDIRTLDTTNEWYYNPSTKKVDIYSLSTPTNVQVSTLDTLVYMTNQNYITFQGINFTGSNTRAIYIGSCQNITIQDCNFNLNGLYAVWGGNNYGNPSSNFNFNNNTVVDVNNQAVALNSEFAGASLTYNVFTNCGRFPGMFRVVGTGLNNGNFCALYTYATDGLIFQHNQVDSSGYDGLQITGSNMDIGWNEISYNELLLMDGGGVNIVGSGLTSRGTKIHDNIIHDGLGNNAGTTDPSNLSHGIYLDIGERHIQVYNNTCFGNGFSGIGEGLDDSCSFTNNTCYNNHFAQFFSAGDYGSGGGLTHTMDTISGNKFISLQPTQLVQYWWSNTAATTHNLYSVCNNNYYPRPIDDNLTLQIVTNNFTNYSNYNLAQWQTATTFDINSHKSPLAITNVNQMSFYYNATNMPSVVTVIPGVDVTNTSYSGSVTLQPYTSLVLINTGADRTPPTANAGTSQTLTWPTNSLTLTGSGTAFGGNTIVGYAWSKFSGPASYGITNAGSPTANVTGLQPGVYQFQLQVTDNTGLTGTSTVQNTVNQGSASLAFSNMTQTYDSSAHSPTVTSTPNGITYNLTLNGISGGRIQAGTYTALAGGNDPNWIISPISGTFTINKATGTITAINQTFNYDGLNHSLNYATFPLGLNVTQSASPSAIGTYSDTLRMVENNYQAAYIVRTITIVSNPANIFISDTSKIYNGAPQAVTVTTAYTHTTTYNGSTTVPTDANRYTVISTITDGIHTGADTAILTILPKSAILSWNKPDNVVFGTLFGTQQLNATADVPGIFVYNFNIGQQIPNGTTTLLGVFTPTSPNYAGGTKTTTISTFNNQPPQIYITPNYFKTILQ